MEFEYSEKRNIDFIVDNIRISLQDFACIYIIGQFEKKINKILLEYPNIDSSEFYEFFYKYELNDYEITYWKGKGVSDDTIEEIETIKYNIYNQMTDALKKVISQI